MNKNALSLLVSLLFLLTTVSASAVQVTISPEGQTVQLYSQASFNMTIFNDQNTEDIFQIYLSGDHLEWYMPSLITKKVKAVSSDSVELNFYPTGTERGKFEFKAFAVSLSNPDAKGSAKFLIEIPFDFIIKNFSATPSGNTINFMAVIWTPEERAIEGTFSLKDSRGKVLGTVPFRETVNGEKTITGNLPISGLVADVYATSISVGNITKSTAFIIKPSKRIIQNTEEVSTWFTKEVTVTVKNEGNVIEKDYGVRQEIPMDLMTGLMTKPGENCREERGAMVCNYVISELKPGATAQLSYSVNYWPAVNGYIILVVIVSGLLIYSFLKVTTPSIFKNHTRKGEDKHNISIHIKNPFFHSLSDVTVRDWVSPLAKVLHEEIESTTPVLRRQDDGSTELLWKLGEVKPREERVLQYKVKTLINGKLKLPGAHMKFSTGKSEKKIKLVSNGVTLG